MSTTLPAGQIAAVRRFSRFYTRQLGLLDEGLLQSAFSLTEARVLYELAVVSPQGLTARDLSRDLGLDPGYLSRLLKSFEIDGFLARSTSPHDGRQVLLALTKAGQAAFAPLDQASQRQIRALLDRLTPEAAARLVQAMRTVEDVMVSPHPEPVVLRQHRLGDIGWIAYRQALLYAQEYGWDGSYEILAAEILAGFVRNFDPAYDGSWIAERANEVVGSVFVMRGSDTVAKLRLLYVEPAARGQNLGRRLVDTCIGFAREKGYRTLTLWTNDVLVPARRIYQAAGFTCVAREPHHSFGKDLMGETWELTL